MKAYRRTGAPDPFRASWCAAQEPFLRQRIRLKPVSDLDFSRTTPEAVAPAEVTRPAASPVYNAAVAMEFFRGAGKGETVPAGGVLFAKDDKTSGLFSKNDKMYLGRSTCCAIASRCATGRGSRS
jgi:hypothetical protein